MPALSAPLQDKIRAMLPPFASPANPVDVTPVWSRFAELYPALTDLLARSGEVDVVVPVLLQRAALDAKTAEGLRDVVAGLRADDVAVPVHVCWVAPRDARPNADLLQDAGVPCFDWPARTARAIGHARRYAAGARADDARRRGPAGADRRRRPPTRCARQRCWPSWASTPRRRRSAAPPTRPSPAGDRVPRGGEAGRGRAPHRAGRGAAWTSPTPPRCARPRRRSCCEQGPVLVQRQLSGVEIAVGRGARPGVRPGRHGRAGRDLGRGARRRRVRHGAPAPRRGPLVARRRCAAHALLTGARGGPSVDLDALADVVVAAGNLLLACPDVVELDLNPVLATAEGAVAVDWKIGVAP